MTTVYTNSPYNDDFNQAKKFYRILFRPGRAVQARELTQLQTILQNQIEQFGKNVYKEGSRISGGEVFVLNGSYIKIQETSNIAGFVGKNITGATSGAKAKVRLVSDSFASNGTSFPSALHIVYTTGIPFNQNETITIDGTTTSVTSQADNDYQGSSVFASVNSGIYFVKGHFVYADSQTVLVGKQFLENPSAVVGFVSTESVISSDDDESLLDPAVGSSNYFAPGADRYSIDLALTSFEYDANVSGALSNAVTSSDFIRIINIENAQITSVNPSTTFNEVENFVAKRTFDESGDYTVTPFISKVVDHRFGNVELCSVQLSPGKAYVRGFNFETLSPTHIDLERARAFEDVNGYSTALTYGRNLTVSNVIGHPGFTASQEVQLFRRSANLIHDSSLSVSNAYVYYNAPFVANPFFGNATHSSNAHVNSYHIGNARVRFISTTNLDTYELYLFDINLKSGNSFSEVRSFVSANVVAPTAVALFSCNVHANAALSYTRDDTYLFPIPYENIKTFKSARNSGVSDTTSVHYKLFPSVSFVSSGGHANAVLSLTGSETFIGSGELADSAINSRIYVSVTSATSPGTAPYVGNVISFAGTSGLVEIVSPTSLKLSHKASQNFTANVYAEISSSTTAAKTKTLTSNTVSFNYATANIQLLPLGKTDIVQVVSIKDSSNTSWLNSYRLDNGQRDDFYDHGRLIFTGNISEANANVFLNASNPFLNVDFEYYESTGSGFFNVDSYIDGGTDYGDIPTYTTSAGVPRRLSDVIDYRPSRQNDGDANVYTFTNDVVASPDDIITGDFEYYLPRRDRLVLTKERQFVLVKGVPSTSPNLPNELPDSMTLYNFDVPAYTARASDVKQTYINNRRYTMRDIGKIEKRVDRIEYYTALSFLEKIATDERNPSTIPGIDRFKNGILVDSFAGHNVSDVLNPDLACSIDFENRYMRPKFSGLHNYFTLIPGSSTGHVKEGDLITINFTPSPLMEQLQATSAVNAAPFDVFNYIGSMKLDPATDVWGDTVNNPSVTVNVNGENDAFTQITLDNTGLTPWGTRWNDWQSVFKGVTDVKVDVSSSTNVDNKINIDQGGKISVTPTATTETTARTTLTTQESSARSGLQFSSAAKTITSSLGDKVVDSSIIPFIRSKPIKFVAQNLRPDTQLFATFDGIDVTQYCVQSSRMQLLSNSATIPTATVIRHLNGATVISEANVLFQRANVIYYQQNNQTNPFVTANSAVVLITSTGTSSQVISALDIADNGVLYTDEYGISVGTFFIPNDDNLKFNMGERPFKLADNLDKRFITTVAETKYLAYGLSTTKEETILATRMNLVSIDPLLQIKKGETTTSTSTTTNRTTVTGTSNEVTLPSADGGVAQTFFCGEQTPQSTGKQGAVRFKVNLGTTIGAANVIFTVGGIPDRLTATYNGEEKTTGFISSLALNSAGRVSYNRRLQDLGYPELSSVVSGTQTISFIKQKAQAEDMIIKVDAPLKGTVWSFKVMCPAGTANPSAGTAKLYAERGGIDLVSRDYIDKRKLLYTSDTNVGLLYFIENTAKNPKFTLPGSPADKSFTITNIEIVPTGLPKGTAKVEGSVSIELNASNRLGVGSTGNVTIMPTFLPTDLLPPPGRINKKIKGTEAIGRGSIGSLPRTVLAGEGYDFNVRIIKNPQDIIHSFFEVRVTAEGPDGKPVTINPQRLGINTTATAKRPFPVDPLAQTFFVNGNFYPQGVFVSSIDLWFRKSAALAPILCEIRPVINGYPSSLEIMPFGQVVLNPEQITASTTFSRSNFSRFKFESPIYLPPGQYAFVVIAQTTEYELYTAIIGEFELDNPTSRIIKQPYIGSMFKSQNASTWTAEQNEDLTFRVNICDFGDAPSASIILNAETPSGNLEYDLINITGDNLNFPDTAITQSFKTTRNSDKTLDSSFRPYSLGSNFPLESRKVIPINSGGGLAVKFELTSTNRFIAPIVDLNRLGSVLVRNIINDPENESPARLLNEDQPSGGNALARYITRRVVLNPGFEAQDIKVYLNAYLPNPSRIKVFFKVNKPGTIDFESENSFQELTIKTVVGDPLTGFAEHTFSTATGTVFTNSEFFSTFSIKIVMLSTDPTQVPIIKDLRVLALEAA